MLPYSAKRIAEGMGNVKKLTKFPAGFLYTGQGLNSSFLCMAAAAPALLMISVFGVSEK